MFIAKFSFSYILSTHDDPSAQLAEISAGYRVDAGPLWRTLHLDYAASRTVWVTDRVAAAGAANRSAPGEGGKPVISPAERRKVR
jgi:hypothetical protein